MDLTNLTHDLTGRLDDIEAMVRDRLPLDRFAAPDPIVRTTWPRRFFWAALGMAAGAGMAYLADPDRGQTRREQLQGRISTTADTAAKRADFAAGKAKGAVAETVSGATPQDVPDDPKVLEARIRSEVFGHRDDVEKVVLRIDGPGTVAVKGTVPSPVSERELLAEIADVDGVTDVSSELSVAGS